MNYPDYFKANNSLNLFGLKKNFQFLLSLYSKKKLPRVLMLSGNKGSGKSTLINHFLYSIFDTENYDKEKNIFNKTSHFLSQFKNNIFENIVYVKGSNFQSVKVDDIRNLKKKLSQSTIMNKDRFIVFDDVELFNHNSLNAMLKTIEEPSKNNFFFLINNKSKPILETIKSRALEIKIIINDNERLKIIENLLNTLKLEPTIDPKISQLSPGNFVKFNYICKEYNINPNDDLLENLSKLLILYKKIKDILFINVAFFIVDYYFRNFSKKRNYNDIEILEIKTHIFNNLNNFMLYNINQNVLLNSISTKLNYE